jgi:predicted ATPase
MERSLSAYRDTGAEWGKPFFMTLMAEAYGKGTKHQKTIGKRFLEQALALIETTHEGFYEAEVYRVLGEYSARAHCHADAEGQIRRALDIARRRNAKSWQLRAATSLAKLWLHQDRKDEARQLLAPVYDSFTEAFDTADLKDARELLSDLG